MGIVTAPNFTQPEIGTSYPGDGRVLRQIVSNMFGASSVLRIEIAKEGIAGTKGWSPIFAIETSGNNAYFKVVDYVGGEGTKPSIPANAYIGASGLVAIGSALNIRGIQGLTGNGITNTSYNSSNGKITITYSNSETFLTDDLRGGVGVGISDIQQTEPTLIKIILSDTTERTFTVPTMEGFDGWSPILATETVDDKIVLKLYDYTGGEGAKPSIPEECYLGESGFTSASLATNIKGPTGIGEPGVGIETISYENTTGKITFTLTNSETSITDDIRGKDGFGSKKTTIETGTDLNTILSEGRYYVANVNSLANKPSGVSEGSWAFIDVIVFETSILQEIKEKGLTHYMRASDNSGLTFNAWRSF